MTATARAHADSAIWVSRSDWPAIPGSFTCLVLLDRPGDRRVCLLSAQHVLSPYGDADGTDVDGGWPLLPCASTGTAIDAPTLGRTLAIGGLMQGDLRESPRNFDAQLAEPDARMIPLIPLRRFHPTRPWVRSPVELETLKQQDADQFRLLTPDNAALPRGAIPLRCVRLPAEDRVVDVTYLLSRDDRATESTVRHRQLVEFEATTEAMAMAGDSGGPVVVTHADGTMTLVAMHIAGNERGAAWAIPAWRLFDPACWAFWPSGATIRPMDVPGA